MKYFISIILCCSLFQSTNGQYNIDSARDVQYKRFAKQLESKFSLDKDADLQFCLWTKGSITSNIDVFMLLQKGEKWQARFFKLVFQDNKEVWIENQIDQHNLDSLWRKLVKNKVSSLPTQSSLNDKMQIYTMDSTFLEPDEDVTYKKISVMDGTSYRFEIKFSNVTRRYYYDNPEKYLKYYPHIEAFFRAFIIISSIKKHLSI